MHRTCFQSQKKQQQGATLVVALLILILIMIIGVTAVNTSSTQYKLAGNLQFDDSALNNAEAAITSAENWLSTGTNYQHTGFTTYDATATPYLLPSTQTFAPLTAVWTDTNSTPVSGNPVQRYVIQQLSTNNVLSGSSQAIGGRANSICNKVNTYQITARGTSARGAAKTIQSFYSVLSCS